MAHPDNREVILQVVAPSQMSTADLIYPFVPWDDRELHTDFGEKNNCV